MTKSLVIFIGEIHTLQVYVTVPLVSELVIMSTTFLTECCASWPNYQRVPKHAQIAIVRLTLNMMNIQ